MNQPNLKKTKPCLVFCIIPLAWLLLGCTEGTETNPNTTTTSTESDVDTKTLTLSFQSDAQNGGIIVTNRSFRVLVLPTDTTYFDQAFIDLYTKKLSAPLISNEEDGSSWIPTNEIEPELIITDLIAETDDAQVGTVTLTYEAEELPTGDYDLYLQLPVDDGKATFIYSTVYVLTQQTLTGDNQTIEFPDLYFYNTFVRPLEEPYGFNAMTEGFLFLMKGNGDYTSYGYTTSFLNMTAGLENATTDFIGACEEGWLFYLLPPGTYNIVVLGIDYTDNGIFDINSEIYVLDALEIKGEASEAISPKGYNLGTGDCSG